MYLVDVIILSLFLIQCMFVGLCMGLFMCKWYLQRSEEDPRLPGTGDKGSCVLQDMGT